MSVNSVEYSIFSESTSVSHSAVVADPTDCATVLPDSFFDGLNRITFNFVKPFFVTVEKNQTPISTVTREITLSNENFDRFVQEIESDEEINNPGLNHLFSSFR
jgi:hypothetical protein